MTITLDGSGLTLDKLGRIARHGEKVELHPEALERIKVCRLMLEEKLAAREVMYGTGEERQEDVEQWQIQIIIKSFLRDKGADEDS